MRLGNVHTPLSKRCQALEALPESPEPAPSSMRLRPGVSQDQSMRRGAWALKHAHHSSHSRMVALTDRSGGCQTVAGRIERRRFGAVFSSAALSPYNKRTMERDCGHLGLYAGCKINKLRVINVMEFK